VSTSPEEPATRGHGRRIGVLVAVCLASSALAFQRPFTYRIDVGRDDDGAYVSGFEVRERGSDRDWRWSAGRSRLIFHNAGQLVRVPRLRLRLTSLQPRSAPAPLVSLAIGQDVVATFEAPRELAVKEIGFETGRLGSGDWVLSIVSQPSRRADGRELAVLVDWAELVSDDGPGWPPWRTTAWLLLGALGLYGLLASRGLGRLAFAAGLAWALLGAAAACGAREAWVEWLPVLAATLATACAASLALASDLPARLRALGTAHASTGLFLGAAAMLGGQLLLTAGAARSLGVGLLVLGVLLVVATPPGSDGSPGDARRTVWIALVACAAIALAMRTYQLEEVPFAIFRDEARHGQVARNILATHSWPPLFLGPPINQPAPYFLALAAVFQAAGPGLWSLRLVSALAGAAAVPLAWRTLRELSGPGVALAAAFALAVSSWHVAVSRFAVNYVVPTVFTLPAYFFLLRALRDRRLRDFALCGLFAGIAQYASHTAKAVLFVLGAALLDAALVEWRGGRRAAVRRVLTGGALAAAVGLLVVTPVLQAAWRAPEAYLSRMRQVSIWHGENAEGEYLLARLGTNLAAYLGAFNVQGDENGRHHLPGAPLLDPLTGACFALGAGLVLAGWRDSRNRFLLYWLGGSILPGLVSVDAPSATRIVEAAPAACAIAAIGLAALAGRARRVLGSEPLRRGALAALAAGALAWNAYVYFVAMYRSPAVWGRSAPVATQLGRSLQAREASGGLRADARLLAPEEFVRHPDELHVLRFFVPGLEVGSFEGGQTPARPGDLVLLPNYRDFWRHVARLTPRYAPRAAEARAHGEAWLGRLEALGCSALEAGRPFPATHDPTYWLGVLP
jgi:4-amino-4-deoxy-L-arabinose transferase-like glycosyltransferase